MPTSIQQLSNIQQITQILSKLHKQFSFLKQSKKHHLIQNKPKQTSKNDIKKILKLFKYKSWQQYMKWVEEKLFQSGEVIKQQEEYKIIDKLVDDNQQNNENNGNNQNYKDQNRIKDHNNNSIIKDYNIKELKFKDQNLPKTDLFSQSEFIQFQLTQEQSEIQSQRQTERKLPQQSKYNGQQEQQSQRQKQNRKAKSSQQLQLLALANGRLRKQNIILKNKLIQLKVSYNGYM